MSLEFISLAHIFDWVALGGVDCGFTALEGKDDVRSLVAMTTKEGQ